jgi:hypothetical protein
MDVGITAAATDLVVRNWLDEQQSDAIAAYIRTTRTRSRTELLGEDADLSAPARRVLLALRDPGASIPDNLVRFGFVSINDRLALTKPPRLWEVIGIWKKGLQALLKRAGCDQLANFVESFVKGPDCSVDDANVIKDVLRGQDWRLFRVVRWPEPITEEEGETRVLDGEISSDEEELDPCVTMELCWRIWALHVRCRFSNPSRSIPHGVEGLPGSNGEPSDQ